MISRAAVSDRIRQSDLRVGKDFLDALERSVVYLIDQGIKRAQWNKRKTVRGADLAYPIGSLGDPERPDGGPKISTEQKAQLATQPMAKEWPFKEVNIGRSGGILRVGPDRRSDKVGDNS